MIIENIKTTYTYNSESLTLNKETTTSYTNAQGTKIQDDVYKSVVTPEMDRSTYESSYKLALTPGSNDAYVAFTYHSMVDDEVNLEYLYTYSSDSAKYTYIFTFVSLEGNVDVNINVTSKINDNNRIVVFKGIDDTDYGENPPAELEDKDQTISATGAYVVRTKIKVLDEEEEQS